MKPKARSTIMAAIVVITITAMAFLPASAQLSQWRSLNPTRDGIVPPPPGCVPGACIGPILYSVHLYSPTVGWAVGGTCDIYTLPLAGAACGVFPANKGFALLYDGTKWRQVLLPGLTKTLASVYVVSPSDVWAVGVGPTLIHWDGVSWVDISATIAALGVAHLFSVFMLPGGNDGWAVGIAAGGGTNNIRWSGIWPGGAWSARPALPAVPVVLRSVSFSSPTFGWIVGSLGEIFKWDGAGWTDLTATSPVVTFDMLSVFAISNTDAWAVGAPDKIIRWNGASWTGPMVAPTLGVSYRSIRMVSASDGWIAGAINPTSGEGTLLRWNGAAWIIVRSYVLLNLNGLSMLLGGAAGSSVGDAETIVYWNGLQWIAQTSPTSFALRGLYLISTNDGWAVGDAGYIYRYDGISWRHYETLPSGITLFSVFMRASNDAWAVGAPPPGAFPPTILRWNGVAWSVVSPAGVAIGQVLFDVFMLSATEGWAVGSGVGTPATILKWDGTLWTSVPSGTPIGTILFGVHMLSSTDGWAVGCTTGGCGPGTTVILRWNGLAWSSFTPPAVPVISGLLDIHMLNANDGWAVGITAPDGQATIIHWDGVQWRRAPGPTTAAGFGLASVRMVTATDGWAVGHSGPRASLSLITHWDGSTWNVVATLPVPPSLAVVLRNVFMVSAFDGWIVSDTGLFLHYGPQVIPGTTTSTLTTFTTTTATLTTGSTTPTPTTSTATTATTASTSVTPVPGFPWESIAAGIITGLATLTLLRVRKRRRA